MASDSQTNPLPHAWTQTIWKGISLSHPAHWELSSVSTVNQVTRLTFSSRHYERLRLSWRFLPARPNLRDIIQNQAETKSARQTEKLARLPAHWEGAYIATETLHYTYAVSYANDRQLLLECAIVWPEGRDENVENQILSRIALLPPAHGMQAWKAMELDIRIPETSALSRWEALVGRLEFTFTMPALPHGSLTARRIALPEYWLNQPLDQWLNRQIPKGAARHPLESLRINSHPAWALRSMAPANPWQRLLGRERSQWDLAWECPIEKRVYHLSWNWQGASPQQQLADSISIKCCQPPSPVHYLPSSQISIESLSQANLPEISPSTALSAIPLRNEAMETQAQPDGSLRISIPVKKPRMLKPPLSWALPYSTHRRVLVDPLGRELIDLCDGANTVESIILAFAQEHCLTFREASLPVVRHLTGFSQRGIIAIVRGSNTPP